MNVYTASIGLCDDRMLGAVEPLIAAEFGVRVMRMREVPEPPNAYDPRRQQYSSVEYLRALATACPREADRLIGLTSRDLCIPMLTFVFGQAQLDGRIAIVSTARLDTQFYGMPSDPEVLLDRLRKEALHEMGHTFGLVHCRDTTCAMSLSTAIQQVDTKYAGYCGNCRTLLDSRLHC
jgi:archaemetzincin